MPPIAAPSHEISKEDIRARLGDSALRIVDVLPRASFTAAHIPGAINLPIKELPKRARSVLADPSQSIAVYCGSFT